MPPETDPSVFVSHVTHDRAVAGWLRTRLEQDFLDMVDVFVSSDEEGIGAGDIWFETITRHLKECSVLVTLCTPDSVYQPWVNFEVGAASALGKRVVPLCHGGLQPDDLKMPFSERQGITLTDPNGIRSLYKVVAEARQSAIPRVDFQAMALEVPAAVSPDEYARFYRLKIEDERHIRRRIREALENHQRWRTPTWVATEAGGVPVSLALMILRADDEVRFSSGGDGKLLVGLKSRVGMTSRPGD